MAALVDSPTFRLRTFRLPGRPARLLLTSPAGWSLTAIELAGNLPDGKAVWACGRCHEAQSSRRALLQSHKRLGITYERVICAACYLDVTSGMDRMRLDDLPDCFMPRWRVANGWPATIG